MCGDLCVQVKFHGNWVSIQSGGHLEVKFGKLDETYTFSKSMPDMNVTNVVLGTRRMTWEGPLTFSCAKTGLSANLVFSEQGAYWKTPKIQGTIRQGNQVICDIDGEVLKDVTFKFGGGSEVFPWARAAKGPAVYPTEDHWDAWESLR